MGSLTPSGAPTPDAIHVACGGATFPAGLLEVPGNAEEGGHPAVAALLRHLADPALAMETDGLPRTGWYLVEAGATFGHLVARDRRAFDGSFAFVSVEARDGGWRVTGWGGCRLEPALPAGLGLAEFRVAPGETLDADSTEIQVLVTERACNSGEDARGRIVVVEITESAESVNVLLAVRPRGGGQDCPSNPETPFTLSLPTPLGGRTLLDGSSVPARDATTCPDQGGMIGCR